MPLTLTATNKQTALPKGEESCTFGPDGGTFGRSDNNDWTLPDPLRYISGKHGSISKDAEGYILTDLSTNGIFVNNARRAVGKSNQARLQAGDVLRCGEYELKVSLAADDEDLPSGPSDDSDLNLMFDDPVKRMEKENRQLDQLLTAKEERGLDTLGLGDLGNPGNSAGNSGQPYIPEIPEIPTVPATSQDPIAMMDDKHPGADDLSDLDFAEENPLGTPTEPDESGALSRLFKPGGIKNQDKQQDKKIAEDWSNLPPQPAAQEPFEAEPNPKDDKQDGAGQSPQAEQNSQTAAPAIPDNIDLSNIGPATTSVQQPSQQLPQKSVQQPAQQPARQKQSAVSQPVQPSPLLGNAPTSIPGREQAKMNNANNNNGGAVQSIAVIFAAMGLPAPRVNESSANMLLKEIGGMINTTVSGMVEVLKSRELLQRDFGTAPDRLRPVEDNPLRIADDPRDALDKLFNVERRSYLKPSEAMKEAMEELSDHQLAMLAGVRAAYSAVMPVFEPEGLIRRFERYGYSDAEDGERTAWYWEMFEHYYDELSQEASTGLGRVFNDVFKHAYDHQIRSATETRRNPRRSPGAAAAAEMIGDLTKPGK